MAQNIYTGFHAVEERVREYIEHPGNAELTIRYSKPGPRIKKILSLAKQAGILSEETTDRELDNAVSNLPESIREHRGIVLFAEGEKSRAANVVQLDQWLSVCPEKATVIMLDGVTDPHNVGAILRSCDQFGALLMILPERRSASDVQENQVIARSSAGASAWVPVSVVANLARSVQMLKDAGFWIYGADAGGESLQKTKFAPKTCIVMGSEGSGMSRLLSEACDTVISIPTCGKIDSLNVSVAAGVLLYERYRQSL
ncbi:MAG TPA: 23S rRNA (guanosine(2251)-2'-O)-methyltransferase RlmB [Treponema sp.]|jgi:23S rRNA (guanosine2251-2'-O)-methyltransferase|nr:23S rRNA (guanosine(2251)-2'-O)-methyltransferase RlmB [Treponema sp.]